MATASTATPVSASTQVRETLDPMKGISGGGEEKGGGNDCNSSSCSVSSSVIVSTAISNSSRGNKKGRKQTLSTGSKKQENTVTTSSSSVTTSTGKPVGGSGDCVTPTKIFSSNSNFTSTSASTTTPAASPFGTGTGTTTSMSEQLEQQQHLTADSSSYSTPLQQQEGNEDGPTILYEGSGGCLTCGADDDHANLLLCEACNDEYHTYCLDPPLRSVPEGDFFCDKCKPLHEVKDDDGLDLLVNALPPSFTSRFGEIIWAAGGVGFGWWPACIYDPRLTVGGARQLARKHLGKKHLVYFFECHDAPFTVLSDSKLTKWEEGFHEEYDMGKTARAMGKTRTIMFEHALQAAIVEYGKPIDMRLEWNHPKVLPPPAAKGKRGAQQQQSTGSAKKKQKKKNTDGTKNDDSSTEKKVPPSSAGKSGNKRRGSASKADRPSSADVIEVDSQIMVETQAENRGPSHAQTKNTLSHPVSCHPERHSPYVSKRDNLNAVLAAMASSTTSGDANHIEPHEDGELFCKVLRRSTPLFPSVEESINSDEMCYNVGFITLPSRRHATFADARHVITTDFDDDCLPHGIRWKFYVPKLGPMSFKQEMKLGPMYDFLKSTTMDRRLGEGTACNPLKVIIVDCGRTTF